VAVREVDANPVECVMSPRQIECGELFDGGATTLQLVDVTTMSGKQLGEVELRARGRRYFIECFIKEFSGAATVQVDALLPVALMDESADDLAEHFIEDEIGRRAKILTPLLVELPPSSNGGTQFLVAQVPRL
jgi:hypothetical protein